MCVCWQEGLGDVKKVVIKESASVKEAVEDAADEVLDGMAKDSIRDSLMKLEEEEEDILLLHR